MKAWTSVFRCLFVDGLYFLFYLGRSRNLISSVVYAFVRRFSRFLWSYSTLTRTLSPLRALALGPSLREWRTLTRHAGQRNTMLTCHTYMSLFNTTTPTSWSAWYIFQNKLVIKYLFACAVAIYYFAAVSVSGFAVGRLRDRSVCTQCPMERTVL